MNVVEIDGLVKDYGRFRAVRGIDLDVRPGEVVGFLGPNGAGKSTTIRCLLDLLRPTAGTVRLFGADARGGGVAARRKVAYVPGELRLPARTTAGELLDAVARLRGDCDPARRTDVTERLGLDPAKPTHGLSTGNRRKVALVGAFMSRAELLVLDEPTSGLDPVAWQRRPACRSRLRPTLLRTRPDGRTGRERRGGGRVTPARPALRTARAAPHGARRGPPAVGEDRRTRPWASA
ncbi:ABC transporter ATP-binding protein [Streptomyces sp. NPDC059202]|uniref:ABC transporter ATP-binding protein n=1 Tax=unclassified Streptomyces TaxID=2593676 RepID=UPI00365BB7E1